MRAIHYAKALEDLLRTEKSGGEKLLAQFVDTITQNGHAHLLPKIVKSYERLAKKESRKSVIEVVSAKPFSENEVMQLLKKDPFKNLLTASHKSVIRKTDETLVGGVVVRTGAMRVDASYKRHLFDLYQSLIST